ncbi:MAG: argininosuccinate lyase [Bernardetiaceae bacterium]
MKIWQKDAQTPLNAAVEAFTVGQDRQLDEQMAAFDVLGSLAHTRMLARIGLLTPSELEQIQRALRVIFEEIQAGHFQIDPQMEDVHSQIEWMLQERIGEAGKKIHSGRSRNDQVLVDLKLFFRDQIEQLVGQVAELFDQLLALSAKHKDDWMPGYTHLQVAMPSSFGLWFGAYAESLTDDMELLLAAWRITNKNPLGSAAGYGSSFPLQRRYTTELLGFDALNYNVIYAQMGRGKTERILAQAMGSIAATLAKMAMDLTLYMSQNFAFVRFPDALTTGSSIMPHKKNPDVLEIIRARCNKIQALPSSILLITNNLPSGYHRDLQLLKEDLFPSFTSLRDCLRMMQQMLAHIEIRTDILSDPKYAYLFSVEAVNARVLQGVSFREAYRQVGQQIADGTYAPDPSAVRYTHEGSIGNLCHDEIRSQFEQTRRQFGFAAVQTALANLLRDE